ncbi:hypothetical protein AALO_G00207560, partial [Alosa alosa]
MSEERGSPHQGSPHQGTEEEASSPGVSSESGEERRSRSPAQQSPELEVLGSGGESPEAEPKPNSLSQLDSGQAADTHISAAQDVTDVRPPLISIRTGVIGHKRIGGQKVKSNNPASSSVVASPVSTAAVSGKRSVLLSNEARKEMVKQAKALKDERRAAIDGRHKYLMSKMADSLSLGEAEVEEALVSDEKFSLIEEFFAAHGSKRLLFFYQAAPSSQWSRHSNLDTVGGHIG